MEPSLLLTRALGTIDRMAEAMWADDTVQKTGERPPHDWSKETPGERERWIRHATAAFLTLLEPEGEKST